MLFNGESVRLFLGINHILRWCASFFARTNARTNARSRHNSVEQMKKIRLPKPPEAPIQAKCS